MPKPRIFVTRVIPQQGLDMVQALSADYDIEVWQNPLPPAYDMLAEKATGLTGLLCLLTDKIDANLMDVCGPQLKVISQMAVGFDNIDIPAATARRIPVGNTPGVLTDATADFAWTLLMAAARRVVEGDKFTRAGKWQTWGPIDFLGPDVSGATLGIVGFGRIGQAVAKRAQGFDMRVLYYDPHRQPAAEQAYHAEYADLDVVLKEADFSDDSHDLIEGHLSLHRRCEVEVDEAVGRVDQYFAWAGGRSGGVVSRAHYRHDRLCRARCDGAGTDQHERSVVGTG